MRGQLYRGHANATALSSSPVAESDDPGSSPSRDKALCPWDVRGKNMQASLLGLAKSIYFWFMSCQLRDLIGRGNTIVQSMYWEKRYRSSYK